MTSESEEEFQDSRSSPAPGGLEEPTPAPGIFPPSFQTGVSQVVTTSMGNPVSSGSMDMESSTEVGISQEDLIEDAKFYQDAAINYQNAYEALLAQQAELQGKFKAQSTQFRRLQWPLMLLKVRPKPNIKTQKEVDSVVSRMAEQYKVQLTSAQGSLQSKDLEHRLEVQRLQETIHALQVSLTEQGAPSLPSVGVSQQVPCSSALWDEVFNIILGTVNQCRGAAQYNSQDQAFSFQKQIKPRSWFDSISRS